MRDAEGRSFLFSKTALIPFPHECKTEIGAFFVGAYWFATAATLFACLMIFLIIQAPMLISMSIFAKRIKLLCKSRATNF